jgi:PadR family transcriptional regulator, regulatory protein AphA
MELSATGRVILGMLSMGPRSGYEIKAFVDRSTRFFWAASYGQIYPELRRLEAAGLIERKGAPQGARRRTVFRLTSAGESELRAWLAQPPEVLELRDEGLLQLFFAGAAQEGARKTLEGKRKLHREKLERLREIEPAARDAAATDPFPYLTLRYGIALTEFSIRWCEDALAELDEGAVERSA